MSLTRSCGGGDEAALRILAKKYSIGSLWATTNSRVSADASSAASSVAESIGGR
jgi:hypothetical protein